MSDDQSLAQYTAEIEAATQRLKDFVEGCTDEQWSAAPVDGDPRPVGVIADHVAHAHEYLAGWMTEFLQGGSPEINPDIVDGLNAEHAASLHGITQAHVADHLKTSCDALTSLVRGLDPAQLDLGGGQVRRMAIIAWRHADNHREELAAGLAAS